MILYYGSTEIIDHPQFGQGKKYNDYGRGFYCTENIELAKEWNCNEGVNGYANRYDLDLTGLRILRLSSDEYTVLHWLAILMDNRIGRMTNPVEKRGREYLLKNFLLDYKNYDVIVGYRANDSYFSFARAFVGNGISINQLNYALRLGKLGEQYVVMSEKAFLQLHFLDYTVADNTVYYNRKRTRDEEAREAFKRELEKDDIEGIYMRDIIREGMTADDVRLQ